MQLINIQIACVILIALETILDFATENDILSAWLWFKIIIRFAFCLNALNLYYNLRQ